MPRAKQMDSEKKEAVAPKKGRKNANAKTEAVVDEKNEPAKPRKNNKAKAEKVEAPVEAPAAPAAPEATQKVKKARQKKAPAKAEPMDTSAPAVATEEVKKEKGKPKAPKATKKAAEVSEASGASGASSEAKPKETKKRKKKDPAAETETSEPPAKKPKKEKKEKERVYTMKPRRQMNYGATLEKYKERIHALAAEEFKVLDGTFLSDYNIHRVDLNAQPPQHHGIILMNEARAKGTNILGLTSENKKNGSYVYPLPDSSKRVEEGGETKVFYIGSKHHKNDATDVFCILPRDKVFEVPAQTLVN